jgi:hypothetical protein
MSFFLSCCGPHPDTLILGNHQQQSKVDISIFISHICIQRNSQVKWSTQPMWWIKMWSRHLNLGVLYTAAHPQMMGGAGLVSGGLSLFIFKPLVPCECLVHSYASFSQGPSVLTKSWLLYGSLGRIMLWWNHMAVLLASLPTCVYFCSDTDLASSTVDSYMPNPFQVFLQDEPTKGNQSKRYFPGARRNNSERESREHCGL